MMQTKMTKLNCIILIFGALMVIVTMFMPISPEKRLWVPIFSSIFYGLLLIDHILNRKDEKFYRLGFWSGIILIVFQILSIYRALTFPY